MVRLKTLYWTAQLRGRPVSPGLHMLNGAVVTLSERVEAVRTLYTSKSEPARLSTKQIQHAVALYQARLLLTQSYGQEAVQLIRPLEGSAGAFPLSTLLPPPPSPTGPLTSLRVLALVDVKLQLIDVRGMVELEVLDLRNNALTVRTFSNESCFACSKCSRLPPGPWNHWPERPCQSAVAECGGEQGP
jgi:hypothetical protein